MTLYRGAGGTGEARTDTDVTEVRIIADEAEGYKDAAAASAMAAASSAAAALQAETNAELAETNAETAETNAEAAQAAAEAAQAAAEAAQLAAETAQTAAELAETNAETAETNAELAEVNAEAAQAAADSFASSAASSASTATTQASNAATSASTATTQAGIATTKAGEAATSATAAQAAQTSAEAARDAALAAYDNFDDRYLGPKASDPTLDNDGNALLTGALYFNTTTNVMKVYEGSVWVAAYVSAAGVLLASNNLSDLTNVSTARTNLGLGTAALVADSTLVHKTGDETIAGTKTFSSTISGSVSGNAGTVTNGVYTTGSYADPSWITSLSGTKLTGTVVATNGVVTTGSYADPAWITSLAGSKVSGNIAGNAANVTGTVAVANGGTGATTASGARTNLDALAATNPSYTGTLTGGTGVVNLGSGQVYKDASGNVGIGTSSPSAKLAVVTNANSQQWLVSQNTNAGSSASNGILFGNDANAAYGTLYLNSSTNTGVGQASGMVLGTYAPTALTFITGSTERARIDSSGNVGIGTSSPGGKLDVSGPDDGLVFFRNATANIRFRPYVTSYATSQISALNSAASAYTPLAIGGSYTVLEANGIERARIDSSGNLLVGTTTANGRVSSVPKSGFVPPSSAGTWASAAALSVSGSYGGGVSWIDGSGGYCAWVDDAGTDFNIAGNTTSNTLSGGVYLNGYAATSWSARSDERLKQSIEPITDAANKVSTLRAVTGEYKAFPGVRQAFLFAQDVQKVLPEAVSLADKNDPEKPLGLAYTQVIPLLVAAIQEQQAMIASQSEIINAQQAALTALTARVEALEPN